MFGTHGFEETAIRGAWLLARLYSRTARPGALPLSCVYRAGFFIVFHSIRHHSRIWSYPETATFGYISKTGDTSYKVTAAAAPEIARLSSLAVMWGNSGYISLVLPPLIAFPVWYLLQNRSKNTLQYPPGPKAYPLIGNLLDFPASAPLWEGFTNLAKQYGGIPLPRGPP